MISGKKGKIITIFFFSLTFTLFIIGIGGSDSKFTIVRLKYDGGGDWYNGPSEIPNLMAELVNRTTILAQPTEKVLEIVDELYLYPVVFVTGHGNIKFKGGEIEKLRAYLLNGGFMYADDDYGMDNSFRREIKRVFPDKEFVEVPFNHPIYHSFYDFPNGAPKIHEHDGGPPPGLRDFP